jgi:hypothetical protein
MSFEECGYPELERALASFLTNERGWIKLAKPRQHGLRLAAELRHGPIALARANLGADVHEFTARIAQLEPEIVRLKGERDRALQALHTGLARGGTTLASRLRQGLEDIADYAGTLVTSYTGPLETQDVAEYIEGAIAPRQTALHEQMRRHQVDIVQEESARAQRHNLYIRLDELLDPDQAAESAAALARVGSAGQAGPPQSPVAVSPTANDLGFWDYVGITALMVISLPFIILDSLQRERFLGRVRFEIDRRYRGGVSDAVRDFERRWRDATRKTLEHFERQCNQNLSTLERQLTDLHDDRRRHAGRAEERRRELDEMESVLERATRLEFCTF